MATVSQKSRTSVSSKGQSKAIVKGTAGATSISNASELSYSSVQGLIASDVQAALSELGQRFYQLSSGTTPSIGVNEGDLWYDLQNSKLKLYDGSDWNKITTDLTSATDTYFRFSTSATLTSGNVAEFRNNTETVLKVQHDGVVVLKQQSTAPTAVANGLYSDGTNAYLGINEQ